MSTNQTISIDLNDVELWTTKITEAKKLQEQISSLISKVERIGHKGTINQELVLAQELLDAVRLAWEMTESAPGEVAAMTMEPVGDDERIELRLRLNQAIATAQETIDVARAELSTK